MGEHDARRRAANSVSRRLALATWLTTTLLSLVALAILVATRDTSVPTSWGFRGASEAFAIVSGTVGLVVATRRPDNLNGWLFCAIGILFAVEAILAEYVILGVLVVQAGLPFTSAAAWLLTWVWILPVALTIVFLPLHFPSGRLLSSRWHKVRTLAVIGTLAFGAALAFEPGPIQQATFVDNPLGLPTDLRTYGSFVIGPAAAVFGIALALALTSLVMRFRRATGEARLQIKWFALAVLVAGATDAAYLSIAVVTLSPATTKLLEVVVVATLLGVPMAAGLAILRYRLYDIDRIISRTIAYGIVTGLLVAGYAALIVVLQGPLSTLTRSDTVLVAVSTLIVAALFQPLRSRVQTIVDRRFDRGRIDAERTSAMFSERLRDQVDIATVTTELDQTVRRAMRPSSLDLWLRGDGR